MTDEEILPTSFDELSDDQQNILYSQWTRENVEPEHVMDYFTYEKDFLKNIQLVLKQCSSVYPYNESLIKDLGTLMYCNFIQTIKPFVQEKFETETEFAMEAMPDTVDQEVDAYFQEQIDNPKCEI